MSKAFKCDRCQKCFDPLSIGKGYFTTIKEYYRQYVMDYVNITAVDREEDIHLCPECAAAFEKFMSNDGIKFEKEGDSDYEKGYMDGFTSFTDYLFGEHSDISDFGGSNMVDPYCVHKATEWKSGTEEKGKH